MIRIIGLVVAAYGCAAAAQVPESQDQDEGLMSTFRQCAQAISNLAQPHAPIDIQITTAGLVQWHLDGKRVVPLRTRIIYERQGGFEKRIADVLCTLDENGRLLEIADR